MKQWHHKIPLLFLLPFVCSCGQGGLKIESPTNGQTISLISTRLSDFLSASYTTSLMNDYWSLGIDTYYPTTIKVTCSEGAETLSISKSADMGDKIDYQVLAGECEITNLESQTTYYAQVSKEGQTSGITSFTTSGDVRTVSIQYAKNTRDAGLWKSYDEDGKEYGKIRQGLLYRSGHLDNVEKTGKATILNELGIKTELDLRKESEVGSDFTPFVEHYIDYDCPQYASPSGGIFDTSTYETVKEVMSVFAEEANYPIIYHCALGRDRTGTVAFLLGCLLGMSEDDICRDYDLSMFFNDGDAADPSDFHRNSFNALIKGIRQYKENEDTLYHNVRVYLKDTGMSDAQLDKIRSILIQTN